MDGDSKIGDQIRQTVTKFENVDNYEAYIISIDQDYDSEEAIFNGYIYKLDTPQFNKVNRSQYGNGCSFDKKFIEYRGKKCFIPTKQNCFVKCNNYLTGQHYKRENVDFIRNEKRRCNFMTMARIHSCLRKLGVDLGYYNEDRVLPRTVTKRDKALYLNVNHIFMIWKSKNVSFNHAINELKAKFKIVDNYFTKQNVKS